MHGSTRYWIHCFVDNDSERYHPNSMEKCRICDYNLNTCCGRCEQFIGYSSVKQLQSEDSKRIWMLWILLMKREPFVNLQHDILWCIYQFLQPSMDIATGCQQTTLACGHTFHMRCIRNAMQCCPVCGIERRSLYTTLGPPIVYRPHFRALSCHTSNTPFVPNFHRPDHRFALDTVMCRLLETPGEDLTISQLQLAYQKALSINTPARKKISFNDFIEVMRILVQDDYCYFDMEYHTYKLNPKRRKLN